MARREGIALVSTSATAYRAVVFHHAQGVRRARPWARVDAFLVQARLID